MRWFKIMLLLHLIASPSTCAEKTVSPNTMDVVFAVFACQHSETDRQGDSKHYHDVAGLHKLVNGFADLAVINSNETRVGIGSITNTGIEVTQSLHAGSTPAAVKSSIKSITEIKPGVCAGSISDIKSKFGESQIDPRSEVPNIIVAVVYYAEKLNEDSKDWNKAAKAIADPYKKAGADIVIVALTYTSGVTMVITGRAPEDGMMNEIGGNKLQEETKALVGSCSSIFDDTKPCVYDLQKQKCTREITYKPNGLQATDRYCVQGIVHQPCLNADCDQHCKSAYEWSCNNATCTETAFRKANLPADLQNCPHLSVTTRLCPQCEPISTAIAVTDETTKPQQTTPEKKKTWWEKNKPSIIGGGVGGLVLAAVAVGLLVCCCRRKPKRNRWKMNPNQKQQNQDLELFSSSGISTEAGGPPARNRNGPGYPKSPHARNRDGSGYSKSPPARGRNRGSGSSFVGWARNAENSMSSQKSPRDKNQNRGAGSSYVGSTSDAKPGAGSKPPRASAGPCAVTRKPGGASRVNYDAASAGKPDPGNKSRLKVEKKPRVTWMPLPPKMPPRHG